MTPDMMNLRDLVEMEEYQALIRWINAPTTP